MAWIGVSYKKIEGVVMKHIDKDGRGIEIGLPAFLETCSFKSKWSIRQQWLQVNVYHHCSERRQTRRHCRCFSWDGRRGNGVQGHSLFSFGKPETTRPLTAVTASYLCCSFALIRVTKRFFKHPCFSDLISAGHRKGVWCQYWIWRAMDCWEERRSHPGRSGSRVERRRGWKDAKS